MTMQRGQGFPKQQGPGGVLGPSGQPFNPQRQPQQAAQGAPPAQSLPDGFLMKVIAELPELEMYTGKVRQIFYPSGVNGGLGLLSMDSAFTWAKGATPDAEGKLLVFPQLQIGNARFVIIIVQQPDWWKEETLIKAQKVLA